MFIFPTIDVLMFSLRSYHILAGLLYPHAHFIDSSVVELLFSLTGFNGDGTEGALANLEAFDAFFMDYSLWEETSSAVRVLPLQGIINSIVANPEKSSNVATLRQLGLVPWLLSLISHVSSSFSREASLLTYGISVARELLAEQLVADELQLIVDAVLSCLCAESENHVSFASGVPLPLPLTQEGWPMAPTPEPVRFVPGPQSPSAASAPPPATSTQPLSPCVPAPGPPAPCSADAEDFTKHVTSVRNALLQMLLDILMRVESRAKNNNASQAVRQRAAKELKVFQAVVDFSFIFSLLFGRAVSVPAALESLDPSVAAPALSPAVGLYRDPDTAVLALKLLLTLFRYRFVRCFKNKKMLSSLSFSLSLLFFFFASSLMHCACFVAASCKSSVISQGELRQVQWEAVFECCLDCFSRMLGWWTCTLFCLPRPSTRQCTICLRLPPELPFASFPAAVPLRSAPSARSV